MSVMVGVRVMVGVLVAVPVEVGVQVGSGVAGCRKKPSITTGVSLRFTVMPGPLQPTERLSKPVPSLCKTMISYH